VVDSGAVVAVVLVVLVVFSGVGSLGVVVEGVKERAAATASFSMASSISLCASRESPVLPSHLKSMP